VSTQSPPEVPESGRLATAPDLVVGARPAERRSLRVLQVAARATPDLGGIETHLDEVGRRIGAGGDIDLTVLATDRTRRRAREEQRDGYLLRRVPAWPRERDYYLAPAIYRQVRRGEWELVHCQGIHTPVPVLAMAAARAAGLPYLVTLHTGGHSLAHRNRLRRVQWRVLGPLLQGAERVIGVSRHEARLFTEVAGLDPQRVLVIRNGGALPVLDHPPDRVPHRVISVGRLERYKGHHRVIEALPSLRREYPDATVEIIGAGPYEAPLRELAARLGVADAVQVRSIPPDDRLAMAGALGRAAVMAALSDYEAHPVAVMEALTLGTPVVGLDVAGVADLVEDGLVRPVPASADAGQVAAALTEVLAAPRTTTAATASAARGPAPVLPTWDGCAQALVETYYAVARSRR
jgi:glycosyltransferase involved in cell wall biosynthesis